MARARNIKPGFFTNDELAQCEYGARLLFIGLWTVADREGRLEDRPLRIKGQLFPYDNCDIEKWLNALAYRGFITRYELVGRKFISVNNFRKHQNPHVNECASTIPAPECSASNPADSLLLIPDSLNSDSLIKETLSSPTDVGDVPAAPDESKPKRKPRTRKTYPEAFSTWYAHYPKKVAKEDASKEFPKAIQRIAASRNCSEEEAMAWLQGVTIAFGSSDVGQSGQFCPHPATWLSQGRYDDDQATWKASNGHASIEKKPKIMPPEQYEFYNGTTGITQ